jgi:GT2 family glycosyltransferase
VNYNDRRRTETCLASLIAAATADGIEVVPVVVNNGFQREGIGEGMPPFQVIDMGRNTGYAGACNAGCELALRLGSTHLLTFNNDATMEPGALVTLLDWSLRHPLSISGPKIVYTARPALVWSAGGYVVRPWMKNHHHGQGEPSDLHQQTRKVDWTTGCAMFFSAETWRKVGCFDEAYFLYLEDVDWCLRAARLGVPTWHLATAVVRHEVSATVSALPSILTRYYGYRNYYRLAFKHAPRWALPLIAGDLVWTLAKSALRWTLFPSYRSNAYYHARTRAAVDFLRGRSGPGPYLALVA